MRFGLAIASLVISGILLLLGIGQRTLFAGPDEISVSVEAGSGTSFVVIPGDRFAAIPGQANLVLTGAESFVATGSDDDVEGWIAPVAHSVLSIDPGTRQAEMKLVEAQPSDLTPEQLQSLDPRGSDLWLSEQDGGGRLPMAPAADQSVLVSTGAGGTASITWAQEDRTPWAGPLLVGGGLFALLGLLLYLLAVDHNRRGLGPRRGRTGPLLGIRNLLGGSRSGSRQAKRRRGAAKRLAAPSLGLVALLALSGCSSSYWPELNPAMKTQQAPSEDAHDAGAAPVPIMQAQIDRVVDDIARVAGEGDDSLDAKVLESRFTGDALAQRTAHYKIRAKVSKYEVVLPRITAEQLDYELVQSTDGWPRTVFVTVASEAPEAAKTEKQSSDTSVTIPETPAASPSLAMVLSQENPHENYHVSRIFALRGGISMPSAAPAEEGTALLADDLKTLVLPPAQVGANYAKVLVGGGKTAEAASFDLGDDTIIEKSGGAWVVAAKKAAKKDGYDVKYSVEAAQTDRPVTSLSTGVGGALVSTTVLESRIEKQAGKYQPKAVGAITALSGLKGAKKRIVSKVAHQLLFFVPSNTSGEKIQLLGYTTELVGASK